MVAAVFVVTPVVVVASLLVTLFWLAGRRAGEALGSSIIEHASAMASGDIRQYLQDAVRVSDLYARRLEQGTLSTADLRAWDRPMLDDLATSPGIASICFGSADGRSIYLQRAHGRLELGLGEGSGPNQCREFELTPGGGRSAEPLRVYQYVPTERPWYLAATQARQPTWTPVYSWFATPGGDTETGAGYTRPIPAPDGSLAGVLTIDVTLSALSDFLERIPIGRGGELFLIDQQGNLVAATDGGVTSDAGARITLAQSPSPVARALGQRAATSGTAGASGSSTPGSSAALPPLLDRVHLRSGWARVATTAFSPYPGLNWRLVTVIPEAAFMADAWATRDRSLIVAGLAVIGSALLALRFAGRLVHPIMALRTHMRRLARGEFDIPLDLKAARELEDLSHDLNSTAFELKNHVEIKQSLALAMQVQQSLLPGQPPRPAGLDLAGKSTYCDQTGGDYYDFIDVHDILMPGATGPSTGTLVVVGDVMGHGIAAALLMATARATLRLRARQPTSLGSILTDVNNVLAPDFREGRFMTMALMLIDPIARSVRWASAGHLPPILYEPGKAQFRTLEGGDFPLGVVAGVAYREYEQRDLEPGTIMAIGTDGIWEAAGTSNEPFGQDRMRDVLRHNARLSAPEISAALDRALASFLGTARPKDDVTYAIAKLI